MPQPICLTREIRAIEEKAGPLPLMERAGAAASHFAASLVPENRKDILVLALALLVIFPEIATWLPDALIAKQK